MAQQLPTKKVPIAIILPLVSPGKRNQGGWVGGEIHPSVRMLQLTIDISMCYV